MIGPNRIIIAAAGSGKTTYLVKEAYSVKDGKVLITTFTESNEEEIKNKFFDLYGHIPPHVVIMTWFTFLINHGIKPYQGGLFDFPVKGMLLVSERSGKRGVNSRNQPIYWSENDFEKHYFAPGRRIYSDKVAKLVMKCEQKSNGNVFSRLSKGFQHIFVDEVQDLAGYDLDVLISFFKSSSRVLLVGDPRQVTYHTHDEAKYKKYANGRLIQFMEDNLPKKIPYEVDPMTLNSSHRNGAEICDLSSKLYPDMQPSSPCDCPECRNGQVEPTGIFAVRRADYQRYLETFKPVQLRDKSTSTGIDQRYPALNFGASKGRGFDRVVIQPTADMLKWLQNSDQKLAAKTRAKFYVALTRARHSVAIVADWKEEEIPAGFSLFT